MLEFSYIVPAQRKGEFNKTRMQIDFQEAENVNVQGSCNAKVSTHEDFACHQTTSIQQRSD